MKKKIAAILLTLSMVVSMVGCGQDAQTGGTQPGGTQNESNSDSAGAENMPSDEFRFRQAGMILMRKR